MILIEIHLTTLLYLVLRFQAGIHWILPLSPLLCGHPHKTGFRLQIMMLSSTVVSTSPPPPGTISSN